MREVHAGVCGPHMGGHMLARKIMRNWLFLVDYGDGLLPARSEMSRVSDTRRSHSRATLRVACIDFTMAIFCVGHRHYREDFTEIFQCPHELISDRGVHFRAEVDTLVQRYGIRIIDRLAYRPQHEWGRATPYSLVYAWKAVLPVEIEMGSLRVALEQQIPETDWAQARFDQLNLLDERRLRAADHVRAYQRKMARAFKKRVKPRPLHGVDSRGRCMADGFRWKPVLRADQCGSAKELICFICLLVDTMFTLGTIRSMAHGIYCTCCISYMRAWVLIIGITCLMRDDSMSPTFPVCSHVRCHTGAYSVSGGSLWIFAEEPLLTRSARFILFDIVVIPGWVMSSAWISRVIISVGTYQICYASHRCYSRVIRTDRIHLMPLGHISSFSHGGDRSPHLLVVRRSRLVEILLAISSSLRFAAACYTGAYFPHIVSLQSGVQSRRSFTVYDIQSHHVTFFKPSPLLSFGVQSRHRFSDRRSESRSRFRRSESLSLLSFGVQSHHHYFSQFRRSESSSVFRSTFRVAFSVSAFRVVITSQFRCSEPSSLFSQFRRSESSSVFRSTFRVPSSVSAFRVVITSQFDVQSHHRHFSVSAFRAIIGFQIDIQSRILGFGVQSHHHFSVSAFRAVIGFQINVQSRVLGFGVQSRYHFSASVFRAIITTSLSFGVQSRHRFSDRRSESRSRFRRSESLSLLSFGVQSHHHYFSQFRRSESSSVFRSTFRVAFSVSAFRVVITSQFRCSEPSSLLLSVSAFRVIIGFQIDIQSPSSVSAFRVVITSQFDVQSHHHHFSVSAFRAIIGFQIDIQSRILGFSVQSRYHFSV
ncbi:hypothetical protein CK203_058023 [Vitis vinifera]|uniref:Integrase catalytic domain-containing protein n=1 Tax=Vitis vinifera TaxID=29760 RepID=A0A438FXM9_VITVI|nr:hypothetical protein CK203_058023 [Vitis vinifera]